MKFNLVLPSQIEADWERIGAAIMWPELWARLQNETAYALGISGTNLLLFVSIGEPSDAPGHKALWCIALNGHVGWRPKSNARLLHEVLTETETLAQRLGCSEIRIEMGDRPGWKRPLLTPMGFEHAIAGGVAYMRKAILDG